jgi:phosphoglycolate phosphatase-like HAD superfamily hydrolase
LIRIALFDVDGTLCDTGGAGRRAFLWAVEQTLETKIDGARVSFAGRTDLAILYDILTLAGVPNVDAPLVETVISRYLERLDFELATGPAGRVYPGIREILERLEEDPEFAVGLLTGNVEAAAQRKLAQFGIAGAFDFGAYGSDDADRDRLVPIARRRAVERLGPELVDAPIVVIGDTPHDIRCARAGAAAAVAVATGFCDVETLARNAPDALLPDLSPTAEVHATLRRLTDPLR